MPGEEMERSDSGMLREEEQAISLGSRGQDKVCQGYWVKMKLTAPQATTMLHLGHWISLFLHCSKEILETG